MTPARTQRGAATLAITLLLLFAMMVVAGIANRNLIFEQRASANQARTTKAFEAAEAGLEWAQAMLASDASIGTDCAPEAAPGNASLRERLLAYDPDSGRFLPRNDADAVAHIVGETRRIGVDVRRFVQPAQRGASGMKDRGRLGRHDAGHGAEQEQPL